MTGEATCSVKYAPLMTGAHEITASYGGDETHEASKGSTTVNATASQCQQGDNDDHNGGGDNDETTVAREPRASWRSAASRRSC